MITFGLHETMPQPKGPVFVERSIVERMADKMLEMGMNGIAVTRASLAEHSGFTFAEIDKHGTDAGDLAKTLAFRHLA